MIFLFFLAFILGQRRGGTTFVMHTLASHEKINDLHSSEILRRWYERTCSTFHFFYYGFNNNNNCSGQTMIKHLTFRIFAQIDNIMKKLSHTQNIDNQTRLDDNDNNFAVVYKLQIEQVPSHVYSDLIKFIHLNNIVIINMQRSATVASFWSYQADTIERMKVFRKSKNVHKVVTRYRTDSDYQNINYSFAIDPYLAVHYVNLIDTKRNELLNLICNYPYGTIEYLTIYYEQLIGNYANVYWTMLQDILNLSHTTSLNSDISRQHDQPCYIKIANWNVIKPKLIGTRSYHACESVDS